MTYSGLLQLVVFHPNEALWTSDCTMERHFIPRSVGNFQRGPCQPVPHGFENSSFFCLHFAETEWEEVEVTSLEGNSENSIVV
jgi:hypothetical protein